MVDIAASDLSPAGSFTPAAPAPSLRGALQRSLAGRDAARRPRIEPAGPTATPSRTTAAPGDWPDALSHGTECDAPSRSRRLARLRAAIAADPEGFLRTRLGLAVERALASEREQPVPRIDRAAR
mgnify:CR=1 FL=1